VNELTISEVLLPCLVVAYLIFVSDTIILAAEYINFFLSLFSRYWFVLVDKSYQYNTLTKHRPVIFYFVEICGEALDVLFMVSVFVIF